LREAIKPEIEWGPALSENRTEAYSDAFIGEDNEAYISSKSTIFSTRENLSTIVVCKNRQNTRNGSVKGQSSPSPKDGSTTPKDSKDTAPPESGEQGKVYTIIKSETCV
jgi:hypothetical protein